MQRAEKKAELPKREDCPFNPFLQPFFSFYCSLSKKVCHFPLPSRDVTDQTLPGLE
jgi:hypothetical protein